MDGLNRITANEARAYITSKWRKKLNEIYNGIRAVLETGADSYTFELSDAFPFTNEIVLRQLEMDDGYRLVKCEWNKNMYTIFW